MISVSFAIEMQKFSLQKIVKFDPNKLDYSEKLRLIFGSIFLLILLVDAFFVIRNYQISDSQIRFIKSVEIQLKSFNVFTENVQSTIRKSIEKPVDLNEQMKGFEKNTSEIIEITSIFDLSENPEYLRLLEDLDRSQKDLNTLTNIVTQKKSETNDNQSLISSRLIKSTQIYRDSTRELQSLCVLSSSHFQFITVIVLGVSGVLLLLLRIGFHFLIFSTKSTINTVNKNPFEVKTDSKNKKELIDLGGSEKEAQLNAILKVKSAQVLKLQESLELAIAFSNKTQQDKNLIYFNISSDLSEYIKVMTLQQKIIENQTNLRNNENWVTLKNAISQLNSLAGNYFNQAKNGLYTDQNSEIYLTQLISEIIVSLGEDNKISFEQVSDMPTIKTNMELLKRTLKPYFGLMVIPPAKGLIRVSAKEDGAFCEFKFFGLSSIFERQFNQIDKLELSDLSFEEFKVHMANKTIRERGGKYWTQSNTKEKGLFTIYWPL